MISKLLNGFMKNIRLAQSCPEHCESIEIEDIPRNRSYSEDLTATSASWDDKREQCLNCKHIYLKFTSPSSGYCSLDCKANATYIAQMKQQPKKTEEDVELVVSFKPISIHVPETIVSTAPLSMYDQDDEEYFSQTPVGPHTFADFHTEKLATRAVEWSFSALY
ncbi:hypothetical protein THRCLA_05171 [Thraustotheca clavata]|uniref:Uncharacterized protein n=1 Tax=Thraustotheca clavata TaxID=74557 RepID=A0A1V9ZWT7_9STRA|nr:hypothetical protein THRCLA_05171 [Thraustotheca clavata]